MSIIAGYTERYLAIAPNNEEEVLVKRNSQSTEIQENLTSSDDVNIRPLGSCTIIELKKTEKIAKNAIIRIGGLS